MHEVNAVKTKKSAPLTGSLRAESMCVAHIITTKVVCVCYIIELCQLDGIWMWVPSNMKILFLLLFAH